MADEVTTGEISRRLDRIEKDFHIRLTELNSTIQNQAYVHKDVLAEILKNIAEDQKAQWAAIQEINERDKRRTGWIVTGVLVPVILIVILQILQLQ